MHSPASVRQITDVSTEPPVRGFLHTPANGKADGLVLTHGAGADCQSRLLTALARVFADQGLTVLRFDLPFRQQRRHGPPFPGGAARDREGLRRAVQFLKTEVPGRVFLAGHSYGGRQSTMLVSEDKTLVAGLLLLSYPLHPPRKPLELRTAHFGELRTPAMFVHGSRDPFGSIEEMTGALKLIAGPTQLVEIAGSGHELLPRHAAGGVPGNPGVGLPAWSGDVPERIAQRFQEFFR